MKITRLDYRDLRTGWYLKDARFDDFNLLVGVSGVGKTKIVEALRMLRSLTIEPRISEAIEWTLDFEENGHSYMWEGRTHARRTDEAEIAKPQENAVFFDHEMLKQDEVQLFRRDGDDVSVGSGKIPGLSARQSCIQLLENDARIRMVKHGFLRVSFAAGNAVPRQGTPAVREALARKLDELIKQLRTAEDDQNGEAFVRGFVDGFATDDETKALHIRLKQELFRDEFNRSVAKFQSIFPSVIDVKAAFADELRVGAPRNLIQVAIKEAGSDEWIPQPEISSGMLRSLLHIFELEASPRGSVIIIDEFENSLGDNCISEMTSLVLSRAPNVQFILTSHHPYVINKIPIETWKLVQREGNTVRLRSARDIAALMSRSRHEAFTRLINLREFEEGIVIPSSVESQP